MSNKWSKFWRLSATERRLLVLAWLVLPMIAALLKAVGFRRLQNFLLWLSPAKAVSGESINELRRAAEIVNSAARNGLFEANCLTRSLTLWWLLRRLGVASQLRFGVRKVDGEFQAHAWLEHCGQVLNDAEDVAVSYSPFEEPLLRFGSR